MKRILGILLVICILLSSLTGCSAVSGAVNKAKILGDWYVEDVDTKAESLYSLLFSFLHFDGVRFTPFELKIRMTSDLVGVGLEDGIRYSVKGDTLKLDVDESQYGDISDEEIPFLEFEISFEGDNLILTNEDFGEFVLSRAE